MTDPDTHARLRGLEQNQAAHEVRIQVSEDGIKSLTEEMTGMRQERRDDARHLHQDMTRLHQKLDHVTAEISLSKGTRRALLWVTGLVATIVAALIGVWGKLTGGGS